MMTIGINCMEYSDTNLWYLKYLDLPYKHLGENPNTGIDCFNLVGLVYRNELRIDIQKTTKDFCSNESVVWYEQIVIGPLSNPFNQFTSSEWGKNWEKIKVGEQKVFDVITIFLGSSNVVNHCALVIEPNRVLNIMIDKPSWVAPYGRYYQHYTDGIYRWKKNINN